jgi:two-component system phosphate regulon response regulator PhoB
VVRVLVIEDHADTLELIRTVLAHAGHDVSVAVDGEDGLRRYRTDRPDVVVVDLFMPRMDGLDVISALREDVGPAAKIIAISAGWSVRGVRAADALKEATARGADCVLRKPLDLEALTATVKDLLARR